MQDYEVLEMMYGLLAIQIFSLEDMSHAGHQELG